MESEMCLDCKFFKEIESIEDHAGSCRKTPPKLVEGFIVESKENSMFDVAFQSTWFPIVAADQWCGEFSRAG